VQPERLRALDHLERQLGRQTELRPVLSGADRLVRNGFDA
jgi:hypothetical protein